jgi:hypothetical protein
MSEAWVLEVLGSVRDMARSQAMLRLAEHIDDAMLIAASEYHETASELECEAGDVRGDTAAVRDAPTSRVN